MNSTPAPIARRLVYQLLFLLWVAFALNYSNRQTVFSIFPALSRDPGMTRAWFGLAGGIFTWAYSLTMPFAGALADRTGRRWTIVASVALWSCATLGAGTSHSAGQFVAWRAITGITEALYYPAALGWIAILVPEQMRSRALALHATAQFAGIAAGGWYGGWIADRIGWRSGFELIAAAGIAYSLLLAVLFRGLPDPKNSREASSRDEMLVFRSRGFLALLAAFFCFCLLLWLVYAWLAAFLYERFHLSMAASGIASTGFLQASAAVGVVLGGFLGDWATHRFPSGRLRVGALGLFGSAPCAWLMFAAPTVALVEYAEIGFGLLSGLFIANIFAAAFDVVAQSRYSFAAGVLNTAGGLAGGAGILLGGLAGHTGLVPVVAFSAVAVALMAVIMLSRSLVSSTYCSRC